MLSTLIILCYTLHEARSNRWVGWCSWDDETLRWVSSCILATSLLKFSTTVKLFMSISMSFLMSSKPSFLFFVTNSARDSCMFWHNRVQHLVLIQLTFSLRLFIKSLCEMEWTKPWIRKLAYAVQGKALRAHEILWVTSIKPYEALVARSRIIKCCLFCK